MSIVSQHYLPGRRRAVAAAAIGVLALTGAAGVAQAQSKPEPYRVGALLSVTGGLAVAGQPEREGVLLAQKVINARGGVNGRQLEILLEDDGSNPDSAVSKANALLHSQKVIAIIGPSAIAQTVAIGGTTQSMKVPMLAFTGLGPPVERERTCVMHMTPAQELNARAMLSYARDNGYKRVGVLHDSGYGQVIWNSMKTLGGEYGIDFAQVEKYELATNDATTQAAKVKAANPDAVLVLGTSPAPFRNIRQLKMTQPVIATHASSTYENVKAMGEGADNIIHAEFLVAEDPLPQQKEFVEAFQKEYGKLPKNFAAAGWDSVMVLAAALKDAGPNPSGDKLCAAVRRVRGGGVPRSDSPQPDGGGLPVPGYPYPKRLGGVSPRLDYKAGAPK